MSEEDRDDIINLLVIMSDGKSEGYYMSLDDAGLLKEYDRHMESCL